MATHSIPSRLTLRANSTQPLRCLPRHIDLLLNLGPLALATAITVPLFLNPFGPNLLTRPSSDPARECSPLYLITRQRSTNSNASIKLPALPYQPCPRIPSPPLDGIGIRKAHYLRISCPTGRCTTRSCANPSTSTTSTTRAPRPSTVHGWLQIYFQGRVSGVVLDSTSSWRTFRCAAVQVCLAPFSLLLRRWSNCGFTGKQNALSRNPRSKLMGVTFPLWCASPGARRSWTL